MLQELGASHEIIIVNDGSRDRSLEVGLELLGAYPCLKILELSRNFGHQAAVTAGMDAALGRAIVLIDADLQDPPEVIAEMVQRWRQGDDVVYGQRRSRKGETAFKVFTAKAFYRILRFLTTIEIPVDTGDFRLMDRRVVHAVGSMREHHRFIRGMVTWVGFRQSAVLYDRNPRHAGTTNYPFVKMLLFSFDAITSFSIRPLRLLMLMGVGITGLSLLGVLLIIFVKLFFPAYFLPGFPTQFLLTLLMGGLNLFGMGVVGEYVGRIYEESKNRPIYLVRNVHSQDSHLNERAGDSST